MKPDLRDGLAFVGLALIATGIGFIYWPLALIVVGGALLALGIGRPRGDH